MECDICGKTSYWCLGHAPFRVEAPGTQPDDLSSGGVS